MGGLLAWSTSSSALGMGVVGILLGVRHTRTDEQTGRTELLGSTRVGRLAPVLAATLTPALACVLIAVLGFAGLVAQGLPAPGSAILASMLGATGLVFVGVGVLAGQLAGSTGSARAVGFVVLGVAFVIAAVGDLTGSPLVYASPFGWSRHAEAYAADRGWLVVLPLALAALLVLIACRVSLRRDLGASLVPDRPGRRTGPAWLGSAFGLAWRRQWRSLVGWAVGLGALGALLGSVTSTLDEQLDTPAFREMSERLGGGDVGRVLFGFVIYVLAQAATAAVLGTALQLRTDESSGLVEPLLTAPVARWRWVLGQLVMAMAVGAGVLTVLGLTAGLVSGDVIGLLTTCWAYLPAVLTMVGFATALVGWLPRIAVPVTWALLVALFGLDLLGEFGLISASVVGLSPYAATFTGLLGQQPLGLVLGLLVVIGVALAGFGLVGIHRRDLRLS